MLEIFIKALDVLIAIFLAMISYLVYTGRFKPKKDTIALLVFILAVVIFLR